MILVRIVQCICLEKLGAHVEGLWLVRIVAVVAVVVDAAGSVGAAVLVFFFHLHLSLLPFSSKI